MPSRQILADLLDECLALAGGLVGATFASSIEPIPDIDQLFGHAPGILGRYVQQGDRSNNGWSVLMAKAYLIPRNPGKFPGSDREIFPGPESVSPNQP